MTARALRRASLRRIRHGDDDDEGPDISAPNLNPTAGLDTAKLLQAALARISVLENTVSSLQSAVPAAAPLPAPLPAVPLPAASKTTLEGILDDFTTPDDTFQRLLHLCRNLPTPSRYHFLVRAADLCIRGPVGPVGHRRALHLVAHYLLNAVLDSDPGHCPALCLKGESLLPPMLHGYNDPFVPRTVVQEAYTLFTNAHNLGSHLGTFLLGRWLVSNEPLHNDSAFVERGYALIKKAADNHCPRALTFLAKSYEDSLVSRTLLHADLPKSKHDREKFILMIYMKAAELNDADALNDLGSSYAQGFASLPADFEKPITFYKMAIKHGSLIAYDNIGTHYETGMDGRFPDRIDKKLAFEYYTLGANRRSAKCAHNLAACYEEGLDDGKTLPRDREQAERLYWHSLLLADDGNDTNCAASAIADLGAMYLTMIKLNPANSKEVRMASDRLRHLIGDDDTIVRTMDKLNRAIAVARSGSSARNLRQLKAVVGDRNADEIMERVRELEESLDGDDDAEAVAAQLAHVTGVPEVGSGMTDATRSGRALRAGSTKRRKGN